MNVPVFVKLVLQKRRTVLFFCLGFQRDTFDQVSSSKNISQCKNMVSVEINKR